jgi:hypothetical protein
MAMDAPQVIATLAAAVLQTVGIRSTTEQPRYTVVDHVGVIEVRRYEGRVAAETEIAGDKAQALNEGFRLVAGYIFGGNSSSAQIAMTAPVAQAPRSEQIAMTAPVAQQPSEGGWRVQFFMPAKYRLETLPKPKDAKVRLVQLPPQTYAVLSFSGSRAPGSVALKQKQLLGGLGGTAWKASGEPQSWFYDPPWTLPFVRLNEAAVLVERR